MKISPVRRSTLPDEIVEQIKRIIFEGELQPGNKLPSERELTERFSVGRTTVREALKALSSMGLIARTKEGTVVNSDISAFFTDPLTQKLILKRINFNELFEARKLLEVKMAVLAAERATVEDIALIQRTLEEMGEEVAHDERKFITADIAFHEAVAEAAQNRVLYELFTAVRHLLWTAQETVVKSPGIMKRSLRHHQQIFEAIKQQDVVAAEKAMFMHLDDVEKALISLEVLD